MKRFVLLSLLAVGCAHAPVEVARSETVALTDSVRVIREAVRAEMLAAATRPASELALGLKLNGEPTFLGVIDFTATSKTNHEATTPFNNTGEALCGKVLLLRPSTAAYIGKAATNTGTVTAANGVDLAAGERVIYTVSLVNCWIAALRVASDGNLKVWELK